MSQMLKSTGAMAVATFGSRVLGFAREAVYAYFMGDGPVAGAFKLAFQIPNLFRRLLGEGALSAAFIPIFKHKEKTEGEVEMWRAANAVISGLMIAAAVIIGVVLIGISLVLAWSAPAETEMAQVVATEMGVQTTVDQTRLMLELLRVMFPYLLLVCVAAVFMGMLNARGYFFIPAMGAAMLNLVMIAAVFLIAPLMGAALDQQIFGLAIGVLVAGLAQALFQWLALRREGFRYHWISPWKNETVRQVVLKMVPGMMGVAAFQVNILLTNAVAFYVDPTIVASFDYAVRLMELPQGVFGISLATFLLPTLAGLAADKKFPEFRATVQQGLGYLIYVNLIASVALIVLAEPIVRLLFERGAFSADSTQRAAIALAFLAPGLVAFSMVNILARAFYALGDTTTPMKISVVCLVLNLIFALILVWDYRQAGLALANTVSGTINVGILLFALRKKLKHLDLSEIRRHLITLAGAAALAAILAWLSLGWWTQAIGHERLWEKIGQVFVPMTLAAVVYYLVTLWAKVPAAHDMFLLVRRRFK